jgi:hypothetical protein
LVSVGAGTVLTFTGASTHPEAEVEAEAPVSHTRAWPLRGLLTFAGRAAFLPFVGAAGVAVGVAAAAPVASGVAIVVSTGEGKGVSAGDWVAVAVGSTESAVGPSVGACVGAAVAVSAGACVGAGVAVAVAVGVGELSAVAEGVGVGSSESAGTPSTATKTVALAKAVARILRVKGEYGRGREVRLPSGVGTAEVALESWS